jgi:O-methyltransferase involved in polyketide biosynthesis
MYDYWLGGHDNFAADRIAALKVAETSPEVPLVAKANRAFLGRAVRYLAGEAGIRQFLDLGTGLPTKGNVHQVAQAITPGAHVVYVDNDPMVFAHARALKTGDGTAVIHADLRDPDTILGHPETRRLIDFSQPLAILFVAVLHYVPDPDAHDAVAAYASAAAPGSHLVLTHVTGGTDPPASAVGRAVFARSANPVTPRTEERVLAFFDGLEILEPGLVPVQQWRPEEHAPAGPDKSWLIGGIARSRTDHVPVPPTSRPRSQQPRRSSHLGVESAPAAVDRPPPGIDATVPTAARMYDYWLGGHDNFAADRIAALKVAERTPGVAEAARANRAFLGRAVRYLAGEAGIRQFLDLGTGLPTKGNVHQVAQALTPDAHVVYVDNDPMVFAHARALKTGDGTAVIHADLRDPDTILGHPETRRLIDFSQPLAILFVSVLHFVPDPDARVAVAAYASAAVPGSHLVLSHGYHNQDPQASAATTTVYASTTSPVTQRTPEEILTFFDGLEILEPGLVPVQQWRPDEPGPSALSKAWILGGVARKQ